MVIIGIDPGSRRTGYGIIRSANNQNYYIACGFLDLNSNVVAERLQKIFFQLQELISLYQPQEAAIEQIFMHANPGSALKLGQARGAAIVALTIPVSEYSARQVKQSVVGFGAAKKEQVQHMVKKLLNIEEDLQADAADALAIALCHAHTRSSILYVGQNKKSAKTKRNTSWRNFRPETL